MGLSVVGDETRMQMTWLKYKHGNPVMEWCPIMG